MTKFTEIKLKYYCNNKYVHYVVEKLKDKANKNKKPNLNRSIKPIIT